MLEVAKLVLEGSVWNQSNELEILLLDERFGQQGKLYPKIGMNNPYDLGFLGLEKEYILKNEQERRKRLRTNLTKNLC